MTCYQLSCGHWQSEADPGFRIGDLLGCIKCGIRWTVVIGMSARYRMIVPGQPAPPSYADCGL